MIGDIMLGVLSLAVIGVMVYNDQQWRKTTSELLDRIQARDLPEYKAVTQEKEKKVQPTPKENDELIQM